LTLAIENNQFSCKDTFTAVIRFLEQPVVNLPNRIVDCAKNTTTISVPPQYSYQVSPSHLANVNADKMVIETSETINLVVNVTSSDGCVLQKTITISSIDGRDTTIDQSRYLCDGKNNIDLQVDSIKGSRILWEVPGYDVLEILSGNQNASPKLIKDYLGPLTAIVYNEIDCSERIYQFEIQDFDIVIPNVFSPNGDKNNDVFRPVMRNDPENEALIIQQLKIFNRWGKEVYNDNKPWDGKMNGQPVKAEVYYYTMTYSVGNHCPKTVTGDVTLLR
jgi:gliding motility-associated-like protein